MNKTHLLNGIALALMLTACGGAKPRITVVCEENNVGNNIVKWETKPALPGRVQVYASTDPDRIPEERPVASARVSDQFVTVPNDEPLARRYFMLVFDGRYRVRVASRNVVVPGVQNFRDLGGYPVYARHKRTRWGRLYRSACIDPTQPATLQKLQALGIRTVIDLRDSALRRPYLRPLPADAGLRVVSVPIPTGRLADILEGIEHESIRSDTVDRIVERLNRQVVRCHAADFRRLFDFLLDERNYPAVIHCTAGKGLTGIASALVLAALGVDEESIAFDYRLSNYFFDIPAASSYAYQLPAAQQEAITTVYSAREEFLDAAKDEAERRYGTVDNYLTRAVGLNKKELRRLRELLLVDEEE